MCGGVDLRHHRRVVPHSSKGAEQERKAGGQLLQGHLGRQVQAARASPAQADTKPAT